MRDPYNAFFLIIAIGLGIFVVGYIVGFFSQDYFKNKIRLEIKMKQQIFL